MPSGLTAVVVPVPQADPLVGPWRERFDKHAAMGVPAHITLLSPFLEPAELPAALPLLQDLLEAAPERFDLSRLRPWPGLAVLEPQPDSWFRAASQALCRRWGLWPYGGKHGDAVHPHLTVAYGDPDPRVEQARFAEIAAAVDPVLPLSCTLDRLWVLRRQGERWRVYQELQRPAIPCRTSM